MMDRSDCVRKALKRETCACCWVEGDFIRGAFDEQGLYVCGFCARRNLGNVQFWVSMYFDAQGNYLFE